MAIQAPYSLDLALQGGGSHGAWTWGVLDRLLEEDDIHIDGITGTSAGAMNATVLAYGLTTGGREKAKEDLHHFWRRIASLGQIVNPFAPQKEDTLFGGGWNLDWSLSYNLFDLMSRLMSPYDLNPLNLNPLRSILNEVIDFHAVRMSSFKVFVTATKVSTGQPRVFHTSQLTDDVLLASACIPMLFQAINIEGEDYWDGGYMGNPSIWPLIYNTDTHDILLAQINPLVRKGEFKRSYQIINRLNEITFNSSLIAEMRAINFVSKLKKEGVLPAHYRDIRMHMVSSPTVCAGLDASSKLNTAWPFFEYLKNLGRHSMEEWIQQHKKNIGKKSTLDIAATFLDKQAKV
jgi:NTE family protein